MKYYIEAFKRIFDFNGKSTLKEFWMFFLFHIIISFAIGFIRGITGFDYLDDIYFTLTFIPFISLGFRRLNDAGFNRWLFLIPFVNIFLVSIKKYNS